MISTARACLVLAALCLPSTANAQAQAPPGWSLDIKIGAPIFIAMEDGDRIEGVAGSVTGGGITVATPVGVRLARFDGIRRVERRDGPKNGIWIGAGVGGALGLAAMAQANCRDEGCRREAVALPVAGALYGALIGWGVDTLIKGRSLIYDGRQAPKVSLAVGRRGLGARIVVSW